jgi:ubiquinone/menaquinone biosynthesis C-methylase UbiE
MAAKANAIAEQIVEVTRRTYEGMADQFVAARGETINEPRKTMWAGLVAHLEAREREGALRRRGRSWRVLDVGTGYGVDLKYAQNELGLDAVGIDNSRTFAELARKAENVGELRHGSVIETDMRDLGMFADSSIDAIAHIASLVHLPVIGPGYMADRALAECRRILRDGGLLLMCVKEGSGMAVVDTEEGLGARFYQFYNEAMVREILFRNRFEVIEAYGHTEVRGRHQIDWLIVFATTLS